MLTFALLCNSSDLHICKGLYGERNKAEKNQNEPLNFNKNCSPELLYCFLCVPCGFLTNSERFRAVLVPTVSSLYSYFVKGCWKKTSKCTRQDRKVVWVFTGILHIGLEEIYKFVFLHVENLFFLSGGLYL